MVNTLLFTPIKIRGVEFPNRMFIPPMDLYATDNTGMVTDVNLGYYAGYAERGFGGVIQEATSVLAEGRITPCDLGIWSDDHIPGLKRIVNVVHAHGAKVGIQLAHAGRKASTYVPGTALGRQIIPESEGGWKVVGPSEDAYNKDHGDPHALTVDEIQERIQAFADAAKRAVTAGYDFIQIHGAHGYLIHEFLSPLSNHRTDEYGGSFENRTRFLKEIVKAVRAVIPKDMPLFVRVSMSDFVEGSTWDIPEVARLCEVLEKEYEVDMMNLSSGGVSPAQVIPSNWDFQLQMAKAIKEQTGIACSAVGGVCNAEIASRVVDEWGIEIVEIGKAALRDAFNPRAIAVDLNQPIPLMRENLRWASRIPAHSKY